MTNFIRCIIVIFLCTLNHFSIAQCPTVDTDNIWAEMYTNSCNAEIYDLDLYINNDPYIEGFYYLKDAYGYIVGDQKFSSFDNLRHEMNYFQHEIYPYNDYFLIIEDLCGNKNEIPVTTYDNELLPFGGWNCLQDDEEKIIGDTIFCLNDQEKVYTLESTALTEFLKYSYSGNLNLIWKLNNKQVLFGDGDDTQFTVLKNELVTGKNYLQVYIRTECSCEGIWREFLLTETIIHYNSESCGAGRIEGNLFTNSTNNCSKEFPLQNTLIDVEKDGKLYSVIETDENGYFSVNVLDANYTLKVKESTCSNDTKQVTITNSNTVFQDLVTNIQIDTIIFPGKYSCYTHEYITPTNTEIAGFENVTPTRLDSGSFVLNGVYYAKWLYQNDDKESLIIYHEYTINDTYIAYPNKLPIILSDKEVTLTAPKYFDSCTKDSIVAITQDPITYNENGEYTVHWEFVDVNGNKGVTTQTVIVDFENYQEPIIEWIRQVKGGGHEYLWGIDESDDGSVYMTGQMSGSIIFDTLTKKEVTGVPQYARTDGFIVKYDVLGNLLWYHILGGDESGEITYHPIALSDNGVMITGRSNSETILDSTDLSQNIVPDSSQNYQIRYDANGKIIWSKVYPKGLIINDIRKKDDNTLIHAGYFSEDIELIVNGQTTQYIVDGRSDGIIFYTDLDGNISSVTEFKGEGENIITRIREGKNQDLYILGRFSGEVDMDPSEKSLIKKSVDSERRQYYLSRLSSSELNWSYHWTEDAKAQEIEVDSEGNLYFLFLVYGLSLIHI